MNICTLLLLRFCAVAGNVPYGEDDFDHAPFAHSTRRTGEDGTGSEQSSLSYHSVRRSMSKKSDLSISTADIEGSCSSSGTSCGTITEGQTTDSVGADYQLQDGKTMYLIQEICSKLKQAGILYRYDHQNIDSVLSGAIKRMSEFPSLGMVELDEAETKHGNIMVLYLQRNLQGIYSIKDEYIVPPKTLIIWAQFCYLADPIQIELQRDATGKDLLEKIYEWETNLQDLPVGRVEMSYQYPLELAIPLVEQDLRPYDTVYPLVSPGYVAEWNKQVPVPGEIVEQMYRRCAHYGVPEVHVTGPEMGNPLYDAEGNQVARQLPRMGQRGIPV